MNEYVHYTNNIANYVILANFLPPIKEKFKDEKVDEGLKINFEGVHSISRMQINSEVWSKNLNNACSKLETTKASFKEGSLQGIENLENLEKEYKC